MFAHCHLSPFVWDKAESNEMPQNLSYLYFYFDRFSFTDGEKIKVAWAEGVRDARRGQHT